MNLAGCPENTVCSLTIDGTCDAAYPTELLFKYYANGDVELANCSGVSQDTAKYSISCTNLMTIKYDSDGSSEVYK